MKHLTKAALVAFALPLLTSPLMAQTVLSGDHSVDGNLCAGGACTGSEVFSGSDVKLKSIFPYLLFEDSGGTSTRDWSIRANDSVDEFFSIVDEETSNQVFRIEPDAPANSLFVSADGRIGIGTNIPQQELHIIGGVASSPVVRLEILTGVNPRAWEILGGRNDFLIQDKTANSIPLLIQKDAPSFSFVVLTNGNIGLGTSFPEEKLHIRTTADNTDAFALFDANGSGSDAAFLLRQNGTSPTTWEFRNQQSSGRLNVGVVGGTKPLKIDALANTNLLRLGTVASNVVSIEGSLRVNNTELNVPDYVFADDYTLRPLADVRSFIDSNSHLPEVPSADDIARDGVDMTEMQMVLLKKVEELTLYTLEQDSLIEEMAARLAVLEAK